MAYCISYPLHPNYTLNDTLATMREDGNESDRNRVVSYGVGRGKGGVLGILCLHR